MPILEAKDLFIASYAAGVVEGFAVLTYQNNKINNHHTSTRNVHAIAARAASSFLYAGFAFPLSAVGASPGEIVSSWMLNGRAVYDVAMTKKGINDSNKAQWLQKQQQQFNNSQQQYEYRVGKINRNNQETQYAGSNDKLKLNSPGRFRYLVRSLDGKPLPTQIAEAFRRGRVSLFAIATVLALIDYSTSRSNECDSNGLRESNFDTTEKNDERESYKARSDEDSMPFAIRINKFKTFSNNGSINLKSFHNIKVEAVASDINNRSNTKILNADDDTVSFLDDLAITKNSLMLPSLSESDSEVNENKNEEDILPILFLENSLAASYYDILSSYDMRQRGEHTKPVKEELVSMGNLRFLSRAILSKTCQSNFNLLDEMKGGKVENPDGRIIRLYLSQNRCMNSDIPNEVFLDPFTELSSSIRSFMMSHVQWKLQKNEHDSSKENTNNQVAFIDEVGRIIRHILLRSIAAVIRFNPNEEHVFTIVSDCQNVCEWICNENNDLGVKIKYQVVETQKENVPTINDHRAIIIYCQSDTHTCNMACRLLEENPDRKICIILQRSDVLSHFDYLLNTYNICEDNKVCAICLDQLEDDLFQRARYSILNNSNFPRRLIMS